jgi:hypothetical protein
MSNDCERKWDEAKRNGRELEFLSRSDGAPCSSSPARWTKGRERVPGADGTAAWLRHAGGAAMRTDWYFIVRADGTEAQSGIYDWRIIHSDGTQSCYIGRFTAASRFRSYERGIYRLLNGLPYRPGNPTGFRKVHHHLAAAVRNGLRVERRIVENCPTDRLIEREQQWIARRRAEGFLMLNG